MNDVKIKQKKRIPRALKWILPAAALLICAMLYFAYSAYHQPGDLSVLPGSDHEDPLLFSCPEEELLSIRIEPYDDEGYTLYYRDGQLLLEDDPYYPLRQNMLYNTILYASYVYAMDEVFDPDRIQDHDETPSLSDFGLDPAVCTVEIQCTDGRSVKLFLGAQAPVDQFIYYYMYTDQSEKVWLVSSELYDSFTYRKNMLHTVEIPDLPAGMISSVSVRGETDISLSIENLRWRITSPFTYPADQEACESLLSRIENIRFSSYIGAKQETDLSLFGLDHPRIDAVFTLDDISADPSNPLRVTHRLLIGNDQNSVSFYCMYDNTVYVGTYFTLGFLTTLDPYSFCPLNPVNFSAQDITELTFITPNASRQYSLSLEERILENGELAIDPDTGERIYDIRVICDDLEVDSDSFLTWYYRLTQITVSGKIPSGTDIASLSPTHRILITASGETRDILISPNNSVSSVVSVNGCALFMIRADWMNTLPELP